MKYAVGSRRYPPVYATLFGTFIDQWPPRLVDTGASMIAINLSRAGSGISQTAWRFNAAVSTANGVVRRLRRTGPCRMIGVRRSMRQSPQHYQARAHRHEFPEQAINPPCRRRRVAHVQVI
jgi:hypothetical protein